VRLQQQIASGQLDPEHVMLYYVYSEPDGKKIKPVTLDDTASFRDQIPGGFFPQRIDEARKLIEARDALGLPSNAVGSD